MLTRADIFRISQTMRQRFVWAHGAHLPLSPSGWKWFRNATSQKFIECLLTVNDQFDTVQKRERERAKERERVQVNNLTLSSLRSTTGLYIDRFFIAKMLLSVFLVWSIKSFGICKRANCEIKSEGNERCDVLLNEMGFCVLQNCKIFTQQSAFQFWYDYFVLLFSFHFFFCCFIEKIFRMNFPRGVDVYWCWWKGVRSSIVLNIDKFKRKLCVRFNFGLVVFVCVCGLLEKGQQHAQTHANTQKPSDEKKTTQKCTHVCEIVHLSVHYWNACNA